MSLPQERSTAEQVFYTWVARSQQARLGLLPSLSSSSAVVLRKGGDLAQVETSTLRKKDPGIAPGPSPEPRGLKYWLCELFLALGCIPHRQLWPVSVGRGVAVLSVS